jgi:SAM-dependent methyltransferase
MGATGLVVDPTNQEQANAWDGDEGAYWAARAKRFDRALGAYRDRFRAAADIGPGDRVLDVGCGTGEVTRDAAREAVDGSALGVDLSARMIDVARQLAAEEGLASARFEQVDAQVHPFRPGAFDVVISRTGTMFFGEPVVAFSNIASGTRPGGRMVLLVWQGPAANEWFRELSISMAAGRSLPTPPTDAPGPFAQSDPDAVRAVLSAAGFCAVECEPLVGPMWFGSDEDDAFEFVLGLMGWMLEGADAARRAQALESLRTTVRKHVSDGGVTFESATWLITASRNSSR